MIGSPKDVKVKKARAALASDLDRLPLYGDPDAAKLNRVVKGMAELLLAWTARPDLDDP
jgi:hypothetical protein